MPTSSFDRIIEVDENSIEQFINILNNEKKIIIEKEQIIKDANVESLRKYFEKE